MNIRNQMDEALDDALGEYLRELFKTFLKEGNESKLISLLRQAETSYGQANKALDTL